MVAAILVVLVAAPMLLRKDVPKASAPIPVVLASRAESDAPARTLASDEKKSETAPPAPARAPAAPPAPRQALAASPEEKDAAKKAEASDQFAAAAPSMAGRVAAAESEAPAVRARENAPEEMENRRDAIAAASAHAPSAHLSIQALDGQGQPPEIASRIPDDRLQSLRGQAFEILVGADGVVREASSPATSADALKKKDALKQGKEGAGGPTVEALRGLRFAAGETPRRLLLRIE
jgi:hypothetical protein